MQTNAVLLWETAFQQKHSFFPPLFRFGFKDIRNLQNFSTKAAPVSKNLWQWKSSYTETKTLEINGCSSGVRGRCERVCECVFCKTPPERCSPNCSPPYRNTHFKLIEGQRRTSWSAYYQTDEHTIYAVCVFSCFTEIHSSHLGTCVYSLFVSSSLRPTLSFYLW